MCKTIVLVTPVTGAQMKFLGMLVHGPSKQLEYGATATEYALMISGIALALYAATIFLGGRLAVAFQTLTDTIF